MKPVISSKSGQYLVEFVIVLLFFSIASTIVFQLFVRGSGISGEAYDLNRAVVRAESITEKVLASGGDEAILSAQFLKTKDGFIVYYDKDWAETDAVRGAYTAEISVRTEDSMFVSDVALKKGAQALYSIQARRYLGAPQKENESGQDE